MTTSKLSDSCEMELFKIKKQELNDNSIDYSLRTQCAETIQQFCPNIESSHVLDCLRVCNYLYFNVFIFFIFMTPYITETQGLHWFQ